MGPSAPFSDASRPKLLQPNPPPPEAENLQSNPPPEPKSESGQFLYPERGQKTFLVNVVIKWPLIQMLMMKSGFIYSEGRESQQDSTRKINPFCICSSIVFQAVVLTLS